MNIWGILVTFICTWWVVIFTTLPFGHVRDEDAEQKGFANSAPINPNIKKKMIVTTAITVVITAMIYTAVELEIVSFRAMIQEWQ